jgi:hypothetical protein
MCVLFNDLLDTTKLDITVMTAISGYTALRLSINIDRGYLPKPVIFQGREILLTAFAYLGIVFLCASILTALIVNPWWTILFILFFTAILSEFVIISLFRQFTYIFSGVTMLLSVYFYVLYIV